MVDVYARSLEIATVSGVWLLGIPMANSSSAGVAAEISQWWSAAQPPELAENDFASR
jgi:hypothetical protein